VSDAQGITDALIRGAVEQYPHLNEEVLRRAIPAAIDVVYAIRDNDGTMHDAGAAAAIAALIEGSIMDNEIVRRARDGAAAVRAGTADYGGNDQTTNVVDALVNIQHFCDTTGVDFDAALGSAREHHTHEREHGATV
jgi:hypothetical protein